MPRSSFKLEYLLYSLIVINLIILASGLFIPISLAIEGDSLDYRIPLIEYAIRHGKWPNFAWTYVDDYPQIIEAVMLFFKKIMGFIGYRIVSALFYIGFFIGTFKFAGIYLERIWAMIVALMVCLMSVVLAQEYTVMVDLAASSFIVFGFYFYFRSDDQRSKTDIWIGIFLGLALATRYTQLPVVLVFIGFIFIDKIILKKISVAFKSSLIIGLMAMLISSPFYLRNILVNANPLFPLFYDLLGGSGFSADRNREIFSLVSGFGFGTTLKDLFLLPVRFAFYPTGFDYSLGPYLLMFLPFAFFRFFKSFKFSVNAYKERRLIVLSGLFLLGWFYTSRNARFLYHFFPLFLVYSIVALKELVFKNCDWKFKSGLGVFFVLLVIVGTAKHLHKVKSDYGNSSDIASLSYVKALNELNCPDARCAVLYYTRAGIISHVKKDFVFAYPHVYSTAVLDHRNYNEALEYLLDLKASGVRYVYSPETFDTIMSRFNVTYLRLVNVLDVGGRKIYEIK